MSCEPQQVKEARETIAALLGRLRPEPSADWIKERTNQVMLQFSERPPDDPSTKPPG